MRRIISFLSGAVLGGIVGATVALLFAPSSGDEMRGQMQSRAEQIQMEFKKAADARRADLEKQLSELRKPAKSPAE